LKSADGESPATALGSVADPAGLVVLDNDLLGDADTKAVDLKVMFGNDPKEWPAVIVARDAVLDLGWVQVVGLEKPIAALDFEKAAPDPAIGADVRAVWRSGRGFDYAPVIARHYISAAIEKPRSMWNLSGDADHAGLAVFDLAGRLVGVVATQTTTAEDDGHASSGNFVLPLSDVRKSLEKAKKLVPAALEKARGGADKDAKPDAKPGDAPKEPAAPEGKPK
jgi:S1-C subfamily serine protease